MDLVRKFTKTQREFFLIFEFAGFFLFASLVFAASAADIKYPVAELGNCQDEQSCKTYCDNISNQEQCIAFGEKQGLIGKEEALRARKFSGRPGPGGCRGAECQAYCADSAHFDECLAFSVENGFIDKAEGERIKKLSPLQEGPGGCKGKDECRTYCDIGEHTEECIAFGEKNGFIGKEEALRARKLAGKSGPGGCQGNACRTYCENPNNQTECLAFAEREGLMPKEEIERAKKFLTISQEGGPGGCKGKEECDLYCTNPEYQEECFQFAKKHGLIRPEDEKNFEVGKKLNATLKESGGPGGCKNENECREYCADAAHTEECIAFASVHGGIPKEEAERMVKEFSNRRTEALDEFRPPEDFRRFEDEARQRFEEFHILEKEFRGDPEKGFQFGPPPGTLPSPNEKIGGSSGDEMRAFVGPGGCSSPADCIQYCGEHQDECFHFRAPARSGFENHNEKTNPLRQDIMHEVRVERPEESEEFKNNEFQKKYQERFQNQINDQMRQMSPEHPIVPTDQYRPTDFRPPEGGSFTPLPQGEGTQPPVSPPSNNLAPLPPPTSMRFQENLLERMLGSVFYILSRIPLGLPRG